MNNKEKEDFLKFRDIIENVGIEIGNVIVINHQINIDNLELKRNEYPKNESEIIKASDRMVLTWIEHLPYPISADEWNVFEIILKIGKSRQLINRYTDLRVKNPGDYSGEERRKTKPLRIL